MYSDRSKRILQLALKQSKEDTLEINGCSYSQISEVNESIQNDQLSHTHHSSLPSSNLVLSRQNYNQILNAEVLEPKGHSHTATDVIRKVLTSSGEFNDSDNSDVDKTYVPSDSESSENDMPIGAKRKKKNKYGSEKTKSHVNVQGETTTDTDFPLVATASQLSEDFCAEYVQNESISYNKKESTVNKDFVAEENDNTKDIVTSGDSSTTQKKWSRKLRKERTEKMNTGKEYCNYKGVFVPPRVSVPLKHCRSKCYEILEEPSDNLTVQHSIFKEYWALGSRDMRVNFIASCVTTKEKETCRKRKPESTKKRQVTHEYSFHIKGMQHKVCKDCFVKTLGEKEKFIRLAIKNKLSSTSGVTRPDGRGKSVPPKNKTSEEKINQVIEHISSFPAYESHYCRQKTQKKYLPSHLNLTIMYKLYKEKYEASVCKTIYENEFRKMNLSFKSPSVDTCSTCDTLLMEIKVLESNGQSIAEVKKKLEDHQKIAETTYEQKRIDKEVAKNDTTKKCYTFDLQQCLPTPFLVSSVAFYKRQLWTYNLTIHDTENDKSVHYMWHEAIAGRGANEIASCLYHFLGTLPTFVTEVTFYSDTCGGQNKNSHVSAMFLKAVTSLKHINTINHKFMVPGHSHMECDVDHAVIERQKKRMPFPVYHPHDWFQLVRSAGKKNQFTVKEMTSDDFFDFAALLKTCLVKRKVNTDGQAFKWHDVQWLQYTQEEGIIRYKKSLVHEMFEELNFRRRGKLRIESTKLTKRYYGMNPISVEKKRDLINILNLIPTTFHDFYKSLTSLQDLPLCDPDLEDFDSEDD